MKINNYELIVNIFFLGNLEERVENSRKKICEKFNIILGTVRQIFRKCVIKARVNFSYPLIDELKKEKSVSTIKFVV